MISDLGIPKGSPNNSSNRANYINNTLMARFMVQLGFNFCISKKIVEILSGATHPVFNFPRTLSFDLWQH